MIFLLLFIVVSLMLSMLAGAALYRHPDAIESWLLGFFVVVILLALIGAVGLGELVMGFGLLTFLWTLILEGVVSRRENKKL